MPPPLRGCISRFPSRTGRPFRRILTARATATLSGALNSIFRTLFRSRRQTPSPWTRTTSRSGIAVVPWFFVPVGTGALLENLADLQGDIVFIKNIDNVLPDRLKPDTCRYKKALVRLSCPPPATDVFSYRPTQSLPDPSESDGARSAIDAARRFAQDQLSLCLAARL